MRTPKLLMAVVCCAMAMPAWAQEHKPDAPKKDDAKAVKPSDKKPGEPPAMSEEDKAWMEAGTPGKMHEWIARGVGTWDCTVKMMMPNQPVQESKGTMTTKMIFEGRFAASVFKGTFMDMPFQGACTLGYNNTTGEFETTWIDSMSTATMMMKGKLDKDGKVLTMTGECMNPATHKMFKQRGVTTWKSDNQFVDEFYHETDGKEAKVMEITYTRAGGGGDAKEMGGKDKGEPGKPEKQNEKDKEKDKK